MTDKYPPIPESRPDLTALRLRGRRDPNVAMTPQEAEAYRDSILRKPYEQMLPDERELASRNTRADPRANARYIEALRQQYRGELEARRARDMELSRQFREAHPERFK